MNKLSKEVGPDVVHHSRWRVLNEYRAREIASYIPVPKKAFLGFGFKRGAVRNQYISPGIGLN